jgi:hypothetical protein
MSMGGAVCITTLPTECSATVNMGLRWTLLAQARWKLGFAPSYKASWETMAKPPPDCPMMVIWSGSPPNLSNGDEPDDTDLEATSHSLVNVGLDPVVGQTTIE